MEKQKFFKERRKSQRIYLTLPLKYKKPEDSCFQQAIACKDLSGGGLKVLLPRPLKIGEKIEVAIYLREGSGPVSAICKVLRCKQEGEDKYGAGLKFLKINDKEDFMQFLCEKLIELSIQRDNP